VTVIQRYRDCHNRNGKPKAAFKTHRQAMNECITIACNFDDEMKPYECPEHGWHIGHPMLNDERNRK
jgi:hypothetical protein